MSFLPSTTALAIELVKYIFALAVEDNLAAPRGPYATLRSAYLVSEALMLPATELLWSSVSLEADADADALLQSRSLGLYRTKAVRMDKWNVEENICEILSHLVGLESLELGILASANAVPGVATSASNLSAEFFWAFLRFLVGYTVCDRRLLSSIADDSFPGLATLSLRCRMAETRKTELPIPFPKLQI